MKEVIIRTRYTNIKEVIIRTRYPNIKEVIRIPQKTFKYPNK